MSMMKRYLEDQCLRIAQKTGFTFDEVLDYINSQMDLGADISLSSVERHFMEKGETK